MYSFQDRQSVTLSYFTDTQHLVRLKKKKKLSRANERKLNDLWNRFLPREINQYIPGSFLCCYPLQGLILPCGERLFRVWKQHCNGSSTVTQSLYLRDSSVLLPPPSNTIHKLFNYTVNHFGFPWCEREQRDVPCSVTTENRNHTESNHRVPQTLTASKKICIRSISGYHIVEKI